MFRSNSNSRVFAQLTFKAMAKAFKVFPIEIEIFVFGPKTSKKCQFFEFSDNPPLKLLETLLSSFKKAKKYKKN